MISNKFTGATFSVETVVMIAPTSFSNLTPKLSYVYCLCKWAASDLNMIWRWACITVCAASCWHQLDPILIENASPWDPGTSHPMPWQWHLCPGWCHPISPYALQNECCLSKPSTLTGQIHRWHLLRWVWYGKIIAISSLWRLIWLLC